MEINILIVLVSFIAGITTVFAPCVFTFLPIILKGVESGNNYIRPLRIVISVSLSVFVFSILLKSTTLLIDIPLYVWEVISGAILIYQGIIILVPSSWDYFYNLFKLGKTNNNLSVASNQSNENLRDILIGFSLGPIFSSCSPTYGYIVAVMLPASLLAGLIYLLTYIFGMSLILLVISVYGNKLLIKFVNPQGSFKKIVGWIILLMGIIIFFGIHKDIESYIIDFLPMLNITLIEGTLLESLFK